MWLIQSCCRPALLPSKSILLPFASGGCYYCFCIPYISFLCLGMRVLLVNILGIQEDLFHVLVLLQGRWRWSYSWGTHGICKEELGSIFVFSCRIPCHQDQPGPAAVCLAAVWFQHAISCVFCPLSRTKMCNTCKAQLVLEMSLCSSLHGGQGLNDILELSLLSLGDLMGVKGKRWSAHSNAVCAAARRVWWFNCSGFFGQYLKLSNFFYYLGRLFFPVWKLAEGSSDILLLPPAQPSPLLFVFDMKWADTICDCANILSHTLPAGFCAAVSSSPFTTALPRGDLNNCTRQQKLTACHGWTAPLLDDLWLRQACGLLLCVCCFHTREQNRWRETSGAFPILQYGDGNMKSSLNNYWEGVMTLVVK